MFVGLAWLILTPHPFFKNRSDTYETPCMNDTRLAQIMNSNNLVESIWLFHDWPNLTFIQAIKISGVSTEFFFKGQFFQAKKRKYCQMVHCIARVTVRFGQSWNNHSDSTKLLLIIICANLVSFIIEEIEFYLDFWFF